MDVELTREDTGSAETAPTGLTTISAAPGPLRLLGDSDAMACEGDACLIPGSTEPTAGGAGTSTR
ncbi:hypothetical protein UA75_20900 [Actinoalloteichus sp. GBA129-24]|uniref:Uncharacterized protein n=2 Tax=Pseudonocardiaceae TaxID=2070 RepID=A0AAC9LFV0_9PSEU|nr:hypothetical protein UA74_20395 [Actinoalloteichus fjordicus]APU22169.1 hypothetical protein UA75_20900 [Actinoalloteichus sp. GBA129-24]